VNLQGLHLIETTASANTNCDVMRHCWGVTIATGWSCVFLVFGFFFFGAVSISDLSATCMARWNSNKTNTIGCYSLFLFEYCTVVHIQRAFCAVDVQLFTSHSTQHQQVQLEARHYLPCFTFFMARHSLIRSFRASGPA
jgi:hypothetical protein